MKAAARLRSAWPAILVAVAIAWQYRAPLLGRVYWFEDIAAYFHPLYTAVARQMRWGSLPSWDLGAWSGQPLLGDPQIGALYPPNWLWLAMPPMRMYAWLTLLHAAFGGAGMWSLQRARGRSRVAAAVAAVTLALGAFLVLQVRHAMFVATTAWLPWLLWAIERYAAERRLELLVAAAGACAMAILGGGWSMLYFAAWVLAVVAVARVLSTENARARLAGGLLAAAAIGLGLAAVQILPALAHARQSPRALGVDYAFASSYAWPSWRYALTLVLPSLYGDDARGSYVGAPDQWELCGYGVGLVATLLALASLFERERRRERIALLALTMVAMELARGDGGFLHPLCFRLLPLYDSLRCPARALYVWTLAAPLLAADGTDAIVARLPERARGLAGAALLCAVALELGFTFRDENPSTALAETRVRPAAVEWMREKAHGAMTNEVHLPQRFHNSGLLWGMQSAGGYSSLPIWRYLHLLWIANHGRPYPHHKLADDLTAQGLWNWKSPIVDLLGVGWVLAPADRTVDARGFHKVFTGPDGIDLWKNDDAYPHGFVVYRAVVAPDEAAQARAVAEPHFRPSRYAVVDRPLDGVPPFDPHEEAPLPTEISALAREGAIDLAVEVEARAPGVLVIGEPWYPGWRVTVDGKATELLRVDYALRGVPLPRGHHEVAMTFEDLPLARGGAVTITALVLVIGLMGLARRQRSA